MSLAEFVGQLNDGHGAKQELQSIKSELDQLKNRLYLIKQKANIYIIYATMGQGIVDEILNDIKPFLPEGKKG